eukprot:5726049-Pyramimonas_sp.AAC.1
MSARDPTPIDPPAALESGDSLADRSPPQEWRSLLSVRVGPHSAGPPAAFESGDSFAVRSAPPRDGEV